jgi:zinc transporter
MSEESCFLFGCALDGLGGAQLIDEPSGSESQPTWAHIDFSAGDAHGWLTERGLAPQVIDTLIMEESRPRTLAMKDGLLVVLRGINHNAGADPEDMVSLRIWIEPTRLISVRQHKVISARDVLAELEQGNGPNNTAELLTRLIEKLADGIGTFVDILEERMENYEAGVATYKTAALRSEVSAVRRQVAVVRRFLAPQREALEALHRLSENTLNTEQQYIVREQSDRTMRYVEDLDLVRERALVVQEELINRTAQEQNARTYILSIVAAIFLPVSFITGLFGMNVGGMPGLEDSNAFWITSGLMLAAACGIVIWLKLKRWF